MCASVPPDESRKRFRFVGGAVRSSYGFFSLKVKSLNAASTQNGCESYCGCVAQRRVRLVTICFCLSIALVAAQRSCFSVAKIKTLMMNRDPVEQRLYKEDPVRRLMNVDRFC